ncbi:hypothetical protein PFISCL1PPCAC_23751, partial [Pristionchus fissidentatus]
LLEFKMMLRTLLAMTLLSLAAAVDFTNSVILTSADINVNVEKALPNLRVGDTYRVYATYASGNGADYARNVLIYDDAASFNLLGLSKAKPNSAYILDNMRILRAPIFIRDQNANAGNRVPFTIYIVSTEVTTFPVVSAQLAGDNVDSNNGFLAAGLTVLSAEQYFTMSSFDIGSTSSMFISSVGFDVSSSNYNMLSLYSPNQAGHSFLTVYGPIATLFNSNFGLNARFRFQFTRNTPFSSQIQAGAAFAIASPGYLTIDKSYNIPYKADAALDRAFQFDHPNFMEITTQAQDIQQGESVQLDVFDASNTAITNMKLQQNGRTDQVFAASSLKFDVVSAPNSNHVPRFLIQVTSGAYSMSLLFLLLASILPKLL